METIVENSRDILRAAPAIPLSIGEQIHALMTVLYPINRSITGDGVRKTFDILKREIPITVYEVPSGTKVFDWTVPHEWNIADAYIKNAAGEKIVDFRKSNLHVLNYSVPVNKTVTLAELKEHLYYDVEHPEWIPYRTSYYKEDWGFCLSYNQYKALKDEQYEVCIDATLQPGYLTYAECFIPGETKEEVLISTHTCHPSLCNDNLSGIGVSTFLIKSLLEKKLRYSYRFVFIPATIGAITWLAQNQSKTVNIRHGLVATLLGDTAPFTYKKSRRDNAEIDEVITHVLTSHSADNKIIDFFPYGYDERQFCSPGFNLPVGRLTRITYGEYPEYHTSADDLTFVQAVSLEESYHVYLEIIGVLEGNKTYVNMSPYGEPQLGKRGLYDSKGGNSHTKDFQMALLWILSLADGEHSLLDIAKKSAMKFAFIRHAADKLVETGLLIEKP